MAPDLPVYPRAVTDPIAFDPRAALAAGGPLSRDQARATLDHAAGLMERSEFLDAARLYQRVIGTDDRAVTSAALLGFGQAMHRLGEEDQAVHAWRQVVGLPATPATYPAWRELAGAHVRSGDLRAALDAYREADRLAPPGDRAEIASRLGWLSKEVGDARSARGYFARARGGSAIAMTVAIIAVTAVVSLAADIGGPAGNQLLAILALDKAAAAHGELWRLATAALVHAPLAQNPLHLPLNMYALWIVGPIVERLYGPWRMLAGYVLAAIAGSLLSFALGDNQASVGASGAIFGLFGLVVSSLAVHRPSLGPNTRSILVNFAVLIGLNLYIGATSPLIDNWAHIGGVLSGAWLGLLFLPTGVRASRSMWHRAGAEPGATVPILGPGGMRLVQAVGVAGLLVAFGVLWSIGHAIWAGVAPLGTG